MPQDVLPLSVLMSSSIGYQLIYSLSYRYHRFYVYSFEADRQIFTFFLLFQMTCLSGSLFQNTVNVVKIRKPKTNTETENVHEVNSVLLTAFLSILFKSWVTVEQLAEVRGGVNFKRVFNNPLTNLVSNWTIS